MNAAKVVEELKQRFPNEPEYIQAVSQVNSWHDNYWGICNCDKCSNGQNNLGLLLMKLRKELNETQ